MTDNLVHPDLSDSIPSDKRGYIHTVVGAAFALLVTLGFMNDTVALTIAGVAIALADLVLVLIYTTASWRKALYPVLYGVGSVLALIGTFNDVQISAMIGLAVAILGTQFAAAKTPVVVEAN